MLNFDCTSLQGSAGGHAAMKRGLLMAPRQYGVHHRTIRSRSHTSYTYLAALEVDTCFASFGRLFPLVKSIQASHEGRPLEP